jgi:hypothetical protein
MLLTLLLEDFERKPRKVHKFVGGMELGRLK